ncbi:uncharacterized protein METZ01_LOCUS413157, partial [marine metagenome]
PATNDDQRCRDSSSGHASTRIGAQRSTVHDGKRRKNRSRRRPGLDRQACL